MAGRVQAQTRFISMDTAGSGESQLLVRTLLPGISRLCALLVIAGAGLVLAGWAAGLHTLIRLIPSLVAMKPMTALLMLAAGISLWRLPAPKSARPDIWGLLLGAVVTLAGGVQLLDYVLGSGFHIDNLLFQAKVANLAAYPPSEMAPNTAFAFVCCGLALVLVNLETRNGVRPGQILMLATGVISLVALIGYSYHVLLLYRVGTAIPMSLETAVGFAILSLGYLAAQPDRGIMRVITSRTSGGAMARRLLPMALLVPWGLGMLLLMGEQAGYYQRQFAVSIFAVGCIVVFTWLIWRNAKLLDMADREQLQAERRLAAQHTATRVLAESPITEVAFAKLLQGICETLGWKFGALWTRGPDQNILSCTEFWRSPSETLNAFAEATGRAAVAQGDDLPGRAWRDAHPVWVEDIQSKPSSNRMSLAIQAGLRSACAFPIWLRQEFFGVMEFYTDRPEQPQNALQEMLCAVATQVGLFVERTRAQAQLHQTSANLQRSNTELQQFAYIASHDLFEPLRMVTSYLHLLRHHHKQELDHQANEFIGLAMDGAKRMEALIKDLLEYSRVDIRGRSFELTEMEHVFAAAAANLKVAVEESGARINHSPLPRVRGDSVQLTQLLQNLIGNAIKFRRAEAPVVDVSAEKVDGEWVFRVKDNGIGIDPKYFDRIFVLFQRLHTRREYAGTGMGLAICRKIVERHGGRIWVESQPGKGATFSFSLPEVK